MGEGADARREQALLPVLATEGKPLDDGDLGAVTTQNDVATTAVEVGQVLALLRLALVCPRTNKADQAPEPDRLVVASAREDGARRVEPDTVDLVGVPAEALGRAGAAELQDCAIVSR